MANYAIADAHTDFLSTVYRQPTVLTDGMEAQLNICLDSLQKGNVRMEFFAAFVDGSRPRQKNASLRCLELIDCYHRMLETWGPENIVEVTKENIDSVIENGPIGAVLTIEGGDVIHGKLGALRMYRRMGVKVMGIIFNHANEIGTSSAEDPDTGLTSFGLECIEEMNHLCMAVDVSHTNRGGFWDALKHSKQPIIATHSNAYGITPNARNLDDEQIRALIDTKGYMGMNFYTPFLTQAEESTLDDLMRHVEHVLALGGEDILGIGSDFDGLFGCPKELAGAQDYPKIIDRFVQAGYSETLIEKICHGNLVRYIKQFL